MTSVRDLPDSTSRLEWDLTVAMAAAVGPERAAKLKVFSRYSLNNDGLDFIVAYEGNFYDPRAIGETGTDSLARLKGICELVKRMLENREKR